MKQVSCLVFHAECMSGLYRLEKTFFLAGGYLHGHILNLGEIIQSRTNDVVDLHSSHMWCYMNRLDRTIKTSF